MTNPAALPRVPPTAPLFAAGAPQWGGEGTKAGPCLSTVPLRSYVRVWEQTVLLGL